MTNTTLNEVHDYWNAESCGERYAVGEDAAAQFAAQAELRYQVEPYIRDFADFPSFKGKNVLEIGVGMGADHSQIALSKPKSLAGVDLTERAIENTKNRFKVLKLNSELKTDNAQQLSFADSTFDAVYSWGVLHHSPDTAQCIAEVHRVLKPGGTAKIMIYHKHAPVGWMLWLKYALLKGKPLTSLTKIYADYLESPGTKVYTVAEGEKLMADFSAAEVRVQLSFGDLLEGDVGARHQGALLKTAKAVYPSWLIRQAGKIFPIGLYLLITAKK